MPKEKLTFNVQSPDVRRAGKLANCSLLLKATVDNHLSGVDGGRMPGHGGGFDVGRGRDLGPSGLPDIVGVEFVEESPPVQWIHGWVTPTAEQQQCVLDFDQDSASLGTGISSGGQFVMPCARRQVQTPEIIESRG